MKKRPTNEDSDEFDVDEPEEFEESGSDWDPQEDEMAGKKRRGRPKSTQKKANKKKKVEKPPSEDEEEDEEDDEDENDDDDEEEQESDEESADTEQADENGSGVGGVALKAFTNGSFVVLKSDLKSKGNPPLWKIDGKALLQKYVPFVLDGKTLYKNTSTYSGWTPSNKDQYAPAPITYMQQGKKEIIVEFNKDLVQLGGKKKEEDEEEKETAARAVDA